MRLHCIGLLLAGAVCATGTTLTGLTEFTTNGSGAWPLGGASYNTHGGDGAWNVYVTAPNSGPNGAFLNSGNAAGASLNVDISAPGTYTFYFYGQGTTLATAGLNLFFNGALPQSAPGISAFGAVNGTSFSANGASSTLPLSYNGGTFPGANSLTFVDGATTVLLTEYAWFNASSTGIPTADRVQPFSELPGSGLDSRGYFTLQVTGPSSAIPEPAAMVLLGSGFAAIVLIRRKKQTSQLVVTR